MEQSSLASLSLPPWSPTLRVLCVVLSNTSLDAGRPGGILPAAETEASR
jgi:hypothetical protein